MTVDYELRIQAGYPIHPEVFDRLYTDWSTLVKFQRTRGVLRLMASVIHSLWEGRATAARLFCRRWSRSTTPACSSS